MIELTPIPGSLSRGAKCLLNPLQLKCLFFPAEPLQTSFNSYAALAEDSVLPAEISTKVIIIGGGEYMYPLGICDCYY